MTSKSPVAALLTLVLMAAGFGAVAGTTEPQPFSPSASSSSLTHSLALREAPAGSWSPNVLLTNGTLCCNVQTEPHAAIDKQGRIVVGWKEASSNTGGGQQVGWTYSHDDGATWGPQKDLPEGSDIVFAIDSQDNMFLNRLGGGCGGQSNAICTHKSTDGGKVWGAGVLSSFETRGNLHDKNWIASDGTNLYQLYEPKDTSRVQATLSVDGGATFTGDYTVGDGTSSIAGPIVIANSAGGAAACFIRSGTIYFDKSADGKAWGADVSIGPGSTTGPDIYKQIPLCMMVQDSTARYYVAYPAAGTAKDIVVSTSTDQGATWSTPVTVNDVGTGDQWHVQGYMCVDSKDRVHIGWRDERSGQMEMMYSNSTDGGKTWSANIKITDAPTPMSFNRPGEYGALICGPDDTLYAAWADGRSDGNTYLDIYFSKMTQGGGGGNNSAPAAPAVTGPATGVTNTSYSYNSSSADPDNDQVRIKIDWGDTTTDMSSLVNSGQNVQLSHQWTAKGTYSVKAQATDARGATSAWGPSIQVVIDWRGGAQNNAPAAPTVTGPLAGKVAQTLSYSAQGTDPDNDQVKYTVDWGDTNTDAGPLVNSGTAHSFSHAWATVGKYTVRAMSTDAKGATSAWGASIIVDITDTGGNNAPAAPTVSGPLSVGVGAAKQYTATGTDPDNDQVKYTVDWGDTTSDTGTLVTSGSPSSFSHSWAATGTYQVKAKTIDSNGAESAWGSPISVKVTDTPDDKPPTIVHTPVQQAVEWTAVEIKATITDDVGVSEAKLNYRPEGATDWQTLPMSATGSVYSATIPGADVRVPRVEYHIEARDAAANIARDPAAGESGPHVIAVSAKGSGSGPGGFDILAGNSGILLLLLVAAVAAGLIAFALLRKKRRKAQPAYASGAPPQGQQWAPPEQYASSPTGQEGENRA